MTGKGARGGLCVWIALLAASSCGRGCGSIQHPRPPPLATPPPVAWGLPGSQPSAPVLRLAGGGGVRPGTTDYSKWEELTRLAEESEAAEGLGHGTNYWKGARVTKLKNPSPVHLSHNEYTIEGEVEGYEGAADYRARTPAPGPFPRGYPRPASGRQGGPEGGPRVEEVDGGGEEEGSAADDEEGAGGEGGGGVELAEPVAAADLDAEKERVRRAMTWQGIDGLEPQPPLDTELADAVSGLDPYEGLPQPREGEDVTFVGEQEARKREGLGPKRKLREPKVQTWEGRGKKWATVDYSKWEDLKYSQSEADGKNRWGPDPPSNDSRFSDDSDDIRVRESIRMDIARAAATRDEHGLRKALRAADAVASTRILQPEEIHAARQVLWEIIDEKEEKQELVWKIREDERRANDSKVLRRQVIAMMTHNGGRTDRFLWCQDADTVTLHVFAPNETKGIDVAVKVKERFLRISLHEPQDDQKSLAKVPAEDRACKCVILGGKTANRIKAEDGELTDWEVQDLHNEDGELMRVVKVVLRKKAPGSNFVPSSFEPWEEQYLGPGNWQESQLRIWWSRVFRTDPEIDVTAIKERGQKASELSSVWQQAHEQFALEVDQMKPIDLSGFIIKEEVDNAKLLTTNQLKAAGVPEGSLQWNQTLAQAEEEATKRARKDMDKARMRQAQRKEEDDALNERWQQHVAEKGDESTDYNSEGDVVRAGFMGSFPQNQPRKMQTETLDARET